MQDRAYAGVSVKSRATLLLRTGTDFFNNWFSGPPALGTS